MSVFLVTGGAGFIGTNITRYLLARGHQVRVMDNLSTGKMENLADLLDQIEFIKGDVTHFETIRNACRGVDYVLHQAAWRAIGRSIDNPLDAHAVNATGTLKVLLAAHEEGVKKVVFASTSAVYGENKGWSSQETDLPDPQSPYAVAKLAGENYCSVFAKLYGLPTVSLRYFNVYGPYGRAESQYSLLIPILLERILKGLPPIIHGSGKQSRDFVYVEDVARANLLAATGPNLPQGAIYNIGSGVATSVIEIAESLIRLSGFEVKPVFEARREADCQLTRASIDKAQRELLFKAKILLPEGLVGSLKWYKKCFAAVSQASR